MAVRRTAIWCDRNSFAVDASSQRFVRGSLAAADSDPGFRLESGVLFELDPALRGIFNGDMHEQGRKLMAMMATAVASLGRLDTLVPTLQTLGDRHTEYPVQPEHYATMGTALLWTLEKGLGGEFTPPVRAAWTNTYTLLADTLIESQRHACATG